jgi:prepilin peptidase CpaA
MNAGALLGLAVFAAAMLAAAGSDLVRRRIPNWLTGGLAWAAIAFALPQDPSAWAGRGVAALLVTAVALVLYARRGLGGGDLKLLAAASLWMPLATLPVFVLALAAAGAVQALVTIAHQFAVAGAGPIDRRMPYGLSIAAAGMTWAFAQGWGCATC